jgi:hypothetical protein
MSEISLKKVRVKVAERSEVMFVGRFPDTLGKGRDLVIREGQVRRWNQGRVTEIDPIDDDPVECFYEILPNSKLASRVLEASRQRGGDKT